MPEDAHDEVTGAADAPASPADAAAEQKRRFKEALDRKRGVQHPDDDVAGGRSLHGRGGTTARQEFRRKSG